MEAADRDAHTLRGGDTAQQGVIYQILQQYYLQNKPENDSHAKDAIVMVVPHMFATNCCFKDIICYNCQNRGHIAEVCRYRPPTGGQEATGNQRYSGWTTKLIQISESDEEDKHNCDVPICTLGERPVGPWQLSWS